MVYRDDFEPSAHGPSRVQAQGGTMSKGCKDYAVDLSAYFDGELEADEQQRIEAHLAECAGCKDTLQRLRNLRGALNALSRPPRRRGSLLQDLQARLQEEERSESPPDPTHIS